MHTCFPYRLAHTDGKKAWHSFIFLVCVVKEKVSRTPPHSQEYLITVRINLISTPVGKENWVFLARDEYALFSRSVRRHCTIIIVVDTDIIMQVSNNIHYDTQRDRPSIWMHVSVPSLLETVIRFCYKCNSACLFCVCVCVVCGYVRKCCPYTGQKSGE